MRPPDYEGPAPVIPPSVPNYYSPNQAQATDQPNYAGVRVPPPQKKAPPAKRAAPPKAPPKAAAKTAPKVGGSKTGAIAPVVQPGPPVAPAAPAWNENMDDTFVGQKSALQKAWEDYQTNQGRETSQYGAQHDANKKALGLQKEQDWHSLEDDYASRGLMNSGLYAKAGTDFNEDYATKDRNLEQARTDFIANLAAAATGFKSDTDIQLEKARQDAINRRQASLGV